MEPAVRLNPGVIPLPLVYAVYLGVAEAARDAALAIAAKRPGNPGLPYLVGEMENDLATARMAHRDMVEAADTGEPGPRDDQPHLDGANPGRPRSNARGGEAMEAAGGSSFTAQRVLNDCSARSRRAVRGPQERASSRFSGRLGGARCGRVEAIRERRARLTRDLFASRHVVGTNPTARAPRLADPANRRHHDRFDHGATFQTA